jgi:aspartate-semialdehyde dehydrogenase
LAAVDDEFGLTSVTVTTLQALSGAGLSGVSALEALGNVIPEIPGEADKIIRETLAVLDIEIPMSVDVHRVPVHTGHLASVRARTRTRPDPGDVAEVMASFRGRPPLPSLPTAPAALIRVHASRSRPQPILDVDAGGGMVLSVGGIGRDDLYDVKFEVLIHNTIRGAAGASVLNAELAVTRGILGVWGLDSEPLEPGCVIGR